MTTTFKNISDKSFSITFTTAEFRNDSVDSDFVSHSGLKWSIHTEVDNDYLDLVMTCDGNESNLWKVEVKCEATLLNKNGLPMTKTSHRRLSYDENGCWSEEFIKMSELENGYIDDGKITIEYVCVIVSVSGIRQNRFMDFSLKNQQLNDIELVVDGKSFYVNKAVLAYDSPVFHAMFFSKFKESNAEKVTLEDIQHEDFNIFLQMIHNCHADINSSNAEDILLLADRFNAVRIIEQCEDYLIGSDEMEIAGKLELAEKYKLSELQCKCIDSIKTIKQLASVSEDNSAIGGKTAKALLKKAIKLAGYK